MFLKNFNFFIKNNNRILLNNFNIFYILYFIKSYYHYSLFNFFYNFNFFFKFSNYFTTLTNVLNIFLQEDFKKKKNVIKFFFFKNDLNTLIYSNSMNTKQLIFKKTLTSMRLFFFKKLFFLYDNFFFKNKLKINKYKKLNIKLITFSIKYINFFLYHYIYFFKNFLFIKNKINKPYLFYKNIFKNYINIKNINQFMFNKNFFLLNNNLLDNFNINTFFFKHLNVYNNQYPLIFFKKFNKFIFFKFNMKKKSNFLNLFNTFLLNFFEFFFKKSFFLKISNKIKLNQLNKIDFFLQNYDNNLKFQNFFDQNEMIEIFCITFIYKDLIFFKNWLTYMLNTINIKNHKKFLSMLNDFVVDNFSIFFNIFNIKGFYLCVKGKIGLSGNAKKKKLFFKKGLLKVSSKNFKIDNQRFSIKTNCGSLGINIILTY